MENKEEDEIYSQQIEYLKEKYPDKQVKIEGYGLTSIDSVINRTDLFSLLKNYTIKCANCGKVLKDDWIVVLHNPKENEKPINVLFFCHSEENKCASEFAKKKF